MHRAGPVYRCWRPQPQHLPYPHCQPRTPGIRFRHTASSQKPSSFSEQSMPPALYPLCRESSGICPRSGTVCGGAWPCFGGNGPRDMRRFRAGALGTVGTPRQRGGAPAHLVGGGHEPGRVGTRGMAVAGAALPGPVEPDGGSTGTLKECRPAPKTWKDALAAESPRARCTGLPDGGRRATSLPPGHQLRMRLTAVAQPRRCRVAHPLRVPGTIPALIATILHCRAITSKWVWA